ncbi:MAG TPA: hypothetical protein VFS39_11290 [Nitrospira sp.]|nr:hypothetical protein [Nitrospira sp.]
MDGVTPDSEILLQSEDQRVIVSPWGASLRRYFTVAGDGRETDIVWGYSRGAGKKGGQGDVLIPFPGRIRGGRYGFDGHEYQLECNDKEGPNAIHGFVRTIPWVLRRANRTEATFEVELEAARYKTRGYPFSLAIELTYELTQGVLACSFAVRNRGGSSAPVGVGFHPYFTVGTHRIDEAECRIPSAAYLDFEDLVPTGGVVRVEGTDWDFRDRRPIGIRRFNHCYVELQHDNRGLATASLRDPKTGRTVEIEMDRSFTAVVVYTGDAISDAPRRALAIEPMTCATDAFNHPEWGLTRLEPDEQCTGRYVIRHRPG